MSNFNKVILAGNLTRDPELRYTPNGSAVGKIGLAINRTWRDQSGAKRTDTTFVDVDCFGKQAETISRYLRKGRPILIEGRLKLDSWEDKQSGQKRSRLGVVLEAFQFLDSGNREASEDTPEETPPTEPSAHKTPAGQDRPKIDDDDVPF